MWSAVLVGLLLLLKLLDLLRVTVEEEVDEGLAVLVDPGLVARDGAAEAEDLAAEIRHGGHACVYRACELPVGWAPSEGGPPEGGEATQEGPASAAQLELTGPRI